MLREVFSLRHRVYCLDRGFLSASNYPDGLELDSYDPFATHFCAFGEDGSALAAARLIRPPAGVRFPYEIYCPEVFPGVELPERHLCAEVSRLVLDRQYYHRAKQWSGTGLVRTRRVDEAHAEEPVFAVKSSDLLLGIYRAVYQTSKRIGIRFWYAAMEQSLFRLLRRLDITFEQIGPEADYYGLVAPYVADLAAVEAKLSSRRPALLDWFRGDAASSRLPSFTPLHQL